MEKKFTLEKYILVEICIALVQIQSTRLEIDMNPLGA
jgi:hypothetical protein